MATEKPDWDSVSDSAITSIEIKASLSPEQDTFLDFEPINENPSEKKNEQKNSEQNIVSFPRSNSTELTTSLNDFFSPLPLEGETNPPSSIDLDDFVDVNNGDIITTQDIDIQNEDHNGNKKHNFLPHNDQNDQNSPSTTPSKIPRENPLDNFELLSTTDIPTITTTDSDSDIDSSDPEDNCYGVNAYLDDLKTESPCIYNMIREGKTRIVVDTTYSHTLDCPVSAARTPMLNEKVFDYYSKKIKREERVKKQQKKLIEKQIKFQVQQQQEQEQAALRNKQLLNTHYEHGEGSSDFDSLKTPHLSPKNEQNDDNNNNNNNNNNKPIDDSIVNIDSDIKIDQNSTNSTSFSISPLQLPHTPPQTNDSISVSTPVSTPVSQNRSGIVGVDSNKSSELDFRIYDTTSDVSSPSSSLFSPGELLQQLQQETQHIESMCTCGGGDDLFSARQCSVDLRAKFISHALSQNTQIIQQNSTPNPQHKIRPISNNSNAEISSPILRSNPNAAPHLLKAYSITWNLFGSLPSTFHHVIPPSVFDLYIISLQECGTVSQALMGTTHTQVTNMLLEAITGGDPESGEYTCIASTYLQTILTFVFIRSPLMKHVHGITKEVIATGYADMFGNKGGVAVRFFLGDTSICAIGSHFNSGQGALEKRNQDYHKISGRSTLGLNDCTVSSLPHSVFPYQTFRNTFRTTSLSAHGFGAISQQYKQFYPHASDIGSRSDVTFWLGDLNYRIHGTKRSVEDMLAFHRHFALIHLDQLNAEKEARSIFYGFKEGIIAFPPTYKYDPGQQCYDTSQKQRIPSWTDRILFRDNCSWCCHQREVCDCLTRPCLYGDDTQTKSLSTTQTSNSRPISQSTSGPAKNIMETQPVSRLPVARSTVTNPHNQMPDQTLNPEEKEKFSTATAINFLDMNPLINLVSSASLPTAELSVLSTSPEDIATTPQVELLSNDIPARPTRPKGFSLSQPERPQINTNNSNDGISLGPPPVIPERKKGQVPHQNCQRVLLEKYGCIQTAIESDHRPVFAHFILACRL